MTSHVNLPNVCVNANIISSLLSFGKALLLRRCVCIHTVRIMKPHLLPKSGIRPPGDFICEYAFTYKAYVCINVHYRFIILRIITYIAIVGFVNL